MAPERGCFLAQGQVRCLAIGYYLGPDDVSRQRSWGVMSNGATLDTHSAGRLYFGIRLESIEAIKFAEDQLGVAEPGRFLRKNPEQFKPIIDEARKLLATPL